MRQLRQLISINFKTFFRDPSILFWAVGFPILISLVLGVAFSQKGEAKKTVLVVNEGNGNAKLPAEWKGKRLLGSEIGSPVRITFREVDEKEALLLMKRGEANLYISSGHDSLVYHFDPANPDAQLTHLLLERDIHPRNEKTGALHPLSSTGNRYIDFLIPGLLAMGMMNSCIWGVGWTLIESRQKKLLRRMVATPMKKWIFLLSHFISRLVLSTVESVVLILFAWLAFHVRIEGNVLALFLIFLCGIFAFGGISVLIASRTRKSETGQGLINVVQLPMMIVSGVFFSYHNFPDWVIPAIKVLPLTLLADTIRAIFIEGAGMQEVMIPALILAGTGLVCFVVGLRVFKWY